MADGNMQDSDDICWLLKKNGARSTLSDLSFLDELRTFLYSHKLDELPESLLS